MNFLEIFKDVTQVSPIMMLVKVLNVKLKPKSNSMKISFEVPYELSESDKEDIADAIKKAYSVAEIEAEYTVVKIDDGKSEKKAEKKKPGGVIFGKPIRETNNTRICEIDQYFGRAVD